MTLSDQLGLRDQLTGLQLAMVVTNCDSCRTNIRAMAKNLIAKAGVTCWCGGEVGLRTPGDGNVPLGCLEDIMHDWTGDER